jgi:aminoglycoside/choline kinase family phosphotransferase
MATIAEKRSLDGADQRDRIDTYLQRSGLATRTPRVVPLTGDASDRRYYRVLLPDADSIVLSLHAEPFSVDSLPFVNVARLLEQMPVPIPRVIGHAGDIGVLALEDLGDVTLQAHLGAASASEHAALYRQAVGLIATMQRRGAELQSPSYMPYAIAFDVEKLAWELDFFTKHFLEGYRGVAVGTAASQALRTEFGGIVRELASEPRVLCHRDYHSRNLMVQEGRLYIIDFQDARMGPDTYDLVSLLRDSYVDLPEQTVGELIAYFLALKGETETERGFRERFNVMALQRNLKALGTFGYQTTARRNPVYIQYIPRTLRYLRDNLEKTPRLGALRGIMAEMIDELK